MGPSFHTIEWRIEPNHVWGQLRCTAPEGAECRLTCPMGCESWPCSHPLEDGGTCNPIEWIENSDGAVMAYGGKEHPLVNGPVEFNWEGEWYEWGYVDEPGYTTSAGHFTPMVDPYEAGRLARAESDG